MNWIKGKPTEAGHYWVKRSGDIGLCELSSDGGFCFEWTNYCVWNDQAGIITHYQRIEKPDMPEDES